MDHNDAVSIISISDLLHRNQPLTGASSLPSSSKPKPFQNTQALFPLQSLNSQNLSPKILTSLKTPSVLIGTLTLPHDSLKCSNKSCFLFSDNSASVCCDVLNFRVRAIGKMIRVLAWNFIPFKHSGFLEIIKWSFLDSCDGGSNGNVLSRCLNVDSCALVTDVSSGSRDEKLKGCYCVYGPVESVSPVSCVPCKTCDGKSQNLRGFVARILICECSFCNSLDAISITNNLVQGNDIHRFRKPLFLYFYGSAARWHPVITKLAGVVVALSELKKKMVFLGKEESQLMYVSTKSSVLHVCFPAKKLVHFAIKSIKGRGECGDYTGVVKGVYMQGMVVELDKEVWLLLTDKLLAVPHSLRLGAIISVRNVHFVNPKFSWTKMLILGACLKTSITIKSFSPFETRSHNLSQTESQLGKFIESLTFSARMWALLLVSCFRQKFAGLLPEKEVLGSKFYQKKGLVQKFMSLHLSPSTFRARHGVLAESCRHDSLGCGSELYCGDLKLVMPICTFLLYCEAIWARALPQFKRKGQKHGTISCGELSGAVPLRRVFSSKDLNVFLLGSLKISPSSGRLQLGDSTGSIDVTLLDSPSNWIADNIYEVVNYSIVMEGVANLSVDLQKFLDNGSLSCRNIFHCTAVERELKLEIYANFQSRNACKNCLIYHHPSQDLDFEQLLSGRFHLILIIHKYPILPQVQVGQMTSNESTVFVEAVVLPWDVSLTGKYGFSDVYEDAGLHLKDSMDDNTGANDEGFFPRKRHKPDETSSGVFALCLTDHQPDGGRELGTSFNSLKTRMKCGNFCFRRTPCTAKVYNACGSNLLVAGKLCCSNCEDKNEADCKRSMVKVLLEFSSETFFNYQLLEIGRCYMIKHNVGDYFCKTTGSDDVSIDNVLITPKTHLWSLSFSSNNVSESRVTSDDVSCQSSIFGYEDVLIKDVNELTLKWPTVNVPEYFSDVCLHLCTDIKVLIEEKLNEIRDGLVKMTAVQEDAFDAPLHTLNAVPVSGSSDSSFPFPEGNLVSVSGTVVAIHDFDFNSADLHLRCESREGDCFHRKFFEGLTGSFCFHVLVENQMVNICSTLSNYAYPIGFGPGVTATFYRLLKLRGAYKWMLTPVSFIVINSISELIEQCCQRFSISSDFQSAMHMPPISTLESVSSGMIYDLIRSEQNQPMQLYCRVVAVHFLVLEKNRKHHYITSIDKPKSPNVNIPVAGFVLDDGSSSCCCWASSLQAATFLRLHEEIKVKWKEVGNRTTVYHLERILRKHERITVRSFGSTSYSSIQELTISVSPDDALCFREETLLKFIMFNACLGTSWTVVASAMDSDAVKQLEKDYGVEMDVPQQHHVLAVEVCHTDELAASKKLIQGLVSR